MKTLSLIAATLGALLTAFNPAFAQGTAFTYQGQLASAGGGVTGLYDFQFAVFDSPGAGTQIGSTIVTNAVGVTNGLFTVTLDFGANIFTGSARWLDLAAHTNQSLNAFVSMTPRQQLTPAPYAVLAGSSTTAASVAGLTIQQNPDGAPNVIGGSPVNFVSSGVEGATIGGGGATNDSHNVGRSYTNSVTGDLGTVGGGGDNTAGGFAFVGGGQNNTASDGATVGGGDRNTASGVDAFVGGGSGNIASGADATIAGGYHNTASGRSAVVGGGGDSVDGFTSGNMASGFVSAIGGGVYNSAGGAYATIPGGYGNVASGNWSFAAGQLARATNDGAFVWADSQNALFSSTNNDSFNVRARGGVRFITGGEGLTVDGVPIGGNGNAVIVQSDNSVVGGGQNNLVQSGVLNSFIGGGNNNTNQGAGSFIGAGNGNIITPNAASSFIGGGSLNTVSNEWSANLGGVGNVAGGLAAVTLGGFQNAANGNFSVVAGYQAQATNQGAFVWADSQGFPFASTANDQFLVRAQGGVGIDTASTPDNGLVINTNTHINDHPIYLRGGTDHNHGLAYNGGSVPNFGNGNVQVDGPVLWGFTGGALAVENGGAHSVLNWTNGGVSVTGSVGVSGDTTVAGSVGVTNNINVNGNATINGNLMANNMPGVNWDQNQNEDITIPDDVEFAICTVTIKIPSMGVLIFSGSISIINPSTHDIIDIYDITSGRNIISQAYVNSRNDSPFAAQIPISMAIPVGQSPAARIYELDVLSVGDTTDVKAHSLNIMYFPRQQN